MATRMHVIYFDTNPSQSEVLQALHEISGAELTIEQSTDYLSISLIGEKKPVEIDWVHQRKGLTIEIKEILGDKYIYPFPAKSQCIRIYSEPTQHNYLAFTLTYLLKQLGGQLEDDVELPIWVGKSWPEVQKSRSWISKLLHLQWLLLL